MLPLERTDLHEDARTLLLRACELAHKHKHAECGLHHVVWAYLEGDPSKTGRRVRVACRMAAQSLNRPPDGAPPLTEALSQILTGDLDREGLYQAARDAGLPPTVRDALETHGAQPESPAAEDAPEEDGDRVRWQRLEMDDGEGMRFVELAVEGDTIYVRRGRTGNRPWENIAAEVEIKTLAGPVTAIRSYEKRIRNLQAKDYALVDPVERPLPDESTADQRRRRREAKDAERKARFARLEHLVLDLFETWHDDGYHPTATFRAEAQRRGQTPAEVTEAFLRRAKEALGVSFTRRAYEPTKDAREPIGHGLLASFYVDPMRVARLAEHKLRGELPRDHDGELPAWSSSQGRPVQLFDATSRALVRFRRAHGV